MNAAQNTSAQNFMMPSERICLKRTRQSLIQSLDVTSVLPQLRAANLFSADEERQIMADSRRRERAIQFLDVLERKNSTTFKAFCNELEEQSPHLYLILSEWDKEEPSGKAASSQWSSGRGRASDEWSSISRCRQYIVSQVDGANIVPLLPAGLLTPAQSHEVLGDKSRESRTETLLELLETRPNSAHQAFIEAVGELYPHVYLELTGKGDDDDDW